MLTGHGTAHSQPYGDGQGHPTSRKPAVVPAAWLFNVASSTSHQIRPSWWRLGRIKVVGIGTAAALWAAVIAGAAALAACGTTGVATAARGGPASVGKALTFYAFDISNGTADPGFIPVLGSSPRAFAQGVELIINDQLTITHQVNGGYPIVGHDAGVCTLTRIPERRADQTLANCVVTAVWKDGSLTVQGVVGFKSRQPEPAVFAVTGGTGRFDGAAGTAGVSFTKNFKILTIRLKHTWEQP
jgi:Dirigent-like protein